MKKNFWKLGVLILATLCINCFFFHFFLFRNCRSYTGKHPRGWDTCRSLSRIPCWRIHYGGYWSQGSSGLIGEAGWCATWLGVKVGWTMLELELGEGRYFHDIFCCCACARSVSKEKSMDWVNQPERESYILPCAAGCDMHVSVLANESRL